MYVGISYITLKFCTQVGSFILGTGTLYPGTNFHGQAQNFMHRRKISCPATTHNNTLFSCTKFHALPPVMTPKYKTVKPRREPGLPDWYIFIPKMPIWGFFTGPWDGKF
jgi:hypothetical protein